MPFKGIGRLNPLPAVEPGLVARRVVAEMELRHRYLVLRGSVDALPDHLFFPLGRVRCLRWGLGGGASAAFLLSLDWVTQLRESHLLILYFLPMGGFVVGWLLTTALVDR